MSDEGCEFCQHFLNHLYAGVICEKCNKDVLIDRSLLGPTQEEIDQVASHYDLGKRTHEKEIAFKAGVKWALSWMRGKRDEV